MKIVVFKCVRAIAAISLLLTLAACTHVAPATRVHIANDVDFQLLPVNDNYTIAQKVAARFRDETHTLIMQVQADNGRLVMAGLSPTGTHLFTVSFDGNAIDSWKSPLFAAPFDGSYVLADYQLASTELASVRKNIAAGSRVSEQTYADRIERTVFDREGTAVIAIIYFDKVHPLRGSVSYCHNERHYCMRIEPLATGATP